MPQSASPATFSTILPMCWLPSMRRWASAASFSANSLSIVTLTVPAEISGYFGRIMEWADQYRTLKVRTNADTPHDAKTAREFGAEGIGLCRTEHMFFDASRIAAVREMILAEDEKGRRAALAKMRQALAHYRVVGVSNNVDFLSRLVAVPAFANADLDTGLIEREQALLFPDRTDVPDGVWQVAALAERLEKENPELVVSRMTRSIRPGKVLLDWSRNSSAKTTVSVYSLRARPEHTASTPVTWEEVEACRRPEDLVFRSDDVLARIDGHGDLFAPLL